MNYTTLIPCEHHTYSFHIKQLDKSWPSGFSKLIQSCWHSDYSQRPTFAEILVKFNELIEEEKKKNGTWALRQLSSGAKLTSGGGGGGGNSRRIVSESTWF